MILLSHARLYLVCVLLKDVQIWEFVIHTKYANKKWCIFFIARKVAPFILGHFFFVINNFYFLFFHTQHNRISKIKQNKTADTYSTSQGSIKREGEREGQQEHKSHSFK